MSPVVKRRRLEGGKHPANQDNTPFASFSDEDNSNGAGSVSAGSESQSHDDADIPSTRSPAKQTPTLNGTSRTIKSESSARDGKQKPSHSRSAARVASTSVGDFQVQQLLSQMRPQPSGRSKRAESALHEVKAVLEKLDGIPPKSIVDAERHLIKSQRVAIPFPDPRPPHDAQYQLAFMPPTSINVTGSYALNTALSNASTVELDMMVQMPDALFQEKDYLEYRYFYRRAYYVACLAAGIKSSTASKFRLQFEHLNANPLQPVLMVTPVPDENGAQTSWKIKIIPFVSTKVFTDKRLLPSKSSLRSPPDAGKIPDRSSMPTVTSFYNSVIQSERQTLAYLKLLHNAAKTCEAFKDACILLRVWLRQRGIGGQVAGGGFGGFESSALVAILLSTGTFSPRYSSTQLFKATLQFLASKDCSKAPVVLGNQDFDASTMSSQVVLFDAARSHNVFYKVTPWEYKSLRADARATIILMGESDAFEGTFISRADALYLKYDLNLALPNQLLTTALSEDHLVLQFRRQLYEILHRGLGDRVTQLDLKSDQISGWDLGSLRPSWRTKGETVISLRLNPATASRSIDHGPSAENKKAAAEYRKFWGEKAELRRFKDSSILESIIWSLARGEFALINDIIKYLVERHLGSATAASLQLLGGDVSRLITHSGGLSMFTPAMEAFKQLESDIRSLDELPLTIRQISPASPCLRYASITHPASSTQYNGSPIDVVIQFESSSRWPDDIHAVQKVKIALLLKLSTLLPASNVAAFSRVGLENSASAASNQSFLDIAYTSNGMTFRVRIHHEREPGLLQNLLKNKTTPPPQREEAAAALAQHKRTFLAVPAHTASISQAATRYPALSATIRLTKMWFGSHHLTSHFPQPLIELFCLHSFLEPGSYGAPSSVQTGLYRTLSFLARWNWKEEPLLLPPSFAPGTTSHETVGTNGEESATTLPENKEQWLRAAHTRFTAWRRLDPSLNRVVLFAASEADADGTVWTDLGVPGGGPSRVAAARMSALARAAIKEITENELGLRPETLFVSGTADFDFVLRLSAAEVGAKKKVVKYKNLEGVGRELEAGFDAAELLLEELKGLYGNSVVFFYGGEGSLVIGALWNPVTEKRAWKVNLAYSTMPFTDANADSVEARINKDAILGEIATLGGNMIEKIESR